MCACHQIMAIIMYAHENNFKHTEHNLSTIFYAWCPLVLSVWYLTEKTNLYYILLGYELDDLGFHPSRVIFTSPNLQTGVGPTLPPVQWVPMLFPKGQSSEGVKFTTHIYPALRWRMNGAVPLIPLYACIMWSRTLPLPSHISNC